MKNSKTNEPKKWENGNLYLGKIYFDADTKHGFRIEKSKYLKSEEK